MKKDCLITKIEASQDGSPYVCVTFSDPSTASRWKAARSIWSYGNSY